MTQYLGTCMVILVAGLVIAILARLVTGGILDEIERIKKRRFEARMESLQKLIKASAKYIEKYMKNVHEAIELDKKYGRDGQKMANEAFSKTMDEMMDDFEIKL